MNFRDRNYWAVLLGGSSGFGLAAAKKLSRCGMNICVVHRDRRGAMARIEKEFDQIRAGEVNFLAFNVDALSEAGRAEVLEGLSRVAGVGTVRVLLHSIAFGSLQLCVARPGTRERRVEEILAEKLGVSAASVGAALDEAFMSGDPRFAAVASQAHYDSDRLLDDEAVASTVYSMGTSLLTWTRALFQRDLFARDARVLGLTSEGNETAWYGYAAVSAAKAALEAISRSIAKEFAPHGIRSNILQPGVTDTPALRLIPGSAHLAAHARLKNPFNRLTQVEDVANVVALLATEEAAWINGSVIRVDGGEAISG